MFGIAKQQKRSTAVGDRCHTGRVGPHRVGSLRWAGREAVVGVSEDAQPVRWGRMRRANVAGGRRFAHQVKVTPEEEAALLVRAEEQGVTVARLLVESALAGGAETAAQRRNLVVELFGVHRLLGTIANNVNQIAKATNATGEWQEQTTAAMVAVRRTCDRIDALVDELGAST